MGGLFIAIKHLTLIIGYSLVFQKKIHIFAEKKEIITFK